jgi:hypothetical protein
MSHLVVISLPLWGHTRPLCVFIAKLQKQSGCLVTFVVAELLLAKVKAEISRQYIKGEEESLKNIRLVSALIQAVTRGSVADDSTWVESSPSLTPTGTMPTSLKSSQLIRQCTMRPTRPSSLANHSPAPRARYMTPRHFHLRSSWMYALFHPIFLIPCSMPIASTTVPRTCSTALHAPPHRRSRPHLRMGHRQRTRHHSVLLPRKRRRPWGCRRPREEELRGSRRGSSVGEVYRGGKNPISFFLLRRLGVMLRSCLFRNTVGSLAR